MTQVTNAVPGCLTTSALLPDALDAILFATENSAAVTSIADLITAPAPLSICANFVELALEIFDSDIAPSQFPLTSFEHVVRKRVYRKLVHQNASSLFANTQSMTLEDLIASLTLLFTELKLIPVY